jgi:radical SAM protein with 4Fe4S-binding SPASM domain
MGIDSISIDSHKLWWHLDRLDDWFNGEVVVPIYIEISPTSRCNHNCIFCGVDFARENPQDLDAEVACGRLEEMGELGVRSVMFAGEGEPLLHSHVYDLAASAYANGIDASITTNGSISPGRWRFLLPLLTWLRFSVDAGTANVYAKIHGCKPDRFVDLLHGIDCALQIKQEIGLNTTIGLQFVLMEENVSDLEAFFRAFTCGEAHQAGDVLLPDYLTIKPYSYNPFSHHVLPKPCVIEDVERFLELCEKYRHTGTEIYFREDAMRVYEAQEHNFQHCHALPFTGIIASDGNFYACPVWTDERFLCGNIYKESMEDIFYGKRRREVIEFGASELDVSTCRVNCRMARTNEFLRKWDHEPQHVNFI